MLSGIVDLSTPTIMFSKNQMWTTEEVGKDKDEEHEEYDPAALKRGGDARTSGIVAVQTRWPASRYWVAGIPI